MRRWNVVVAALVLLGACSDDGDTSPDSTVDSILVDGPVSGPDSPPPKHDGSQAKDGKGGADGSTSDGTKSCTFKGINLWGKVKQVTIGEDIKVRVVTLGEDLRVQLVNLPPVNSSQSCGKWNMVNFGEDFKIRIVTLAGDLKIRYVTFNPGLP